MRRGVGFSLVMTAVGALGVGASFVPHLLRDMDLFRVRNFRVVGARYVTRAEALAWAGVAEGASVWDDPAAWEAGLRSDPLVLDAAVERKLPHTLVFRVRERKPVALLPTPVLKPVDAAGKLLPLDPSVHRMDLPVIRPVREGDGRRLSRAELKEVAGEMGRLAEVDPRFLASVSEVEVGRREGLVAKLMDPSVQVRFRPPLASGRLQEGLQALSDAMRRNGGSVPRSVDLRFEDQVVVRFGTSKNVNALQSE